MQSSSTRNHSAAPGTFKACFHLPFDWLGTILIMSAACTVGATEAPSPETTSSGSLSPVFGVHGTAAMPEANPSLNGSSSTNTLHDPVVTERRAGRTLRSLLIGGHSLDGEGMILWSGGRPGRRSNAGTPLPQDSASGHTPQATDETQHEMTLPSVNEEVVQHWEPAGQGTGEQALTFTDVDNRTSVIADAPLEDGAGNMPSGTRSAPTGAFDSEMVTSEATGAGNDQWLAFSDVLVGEPESMESLARMLQWELELTTIEVPGVPEASPAWLWTLGLLGLIASSALRRWRGRVQTSPV